MKTFVKQWISWWCLFIMFSLIIQLLSVLKYSNFVRGALVVIFAVFQWMLLSCLQTWRCKSSVLHFEYWTIVSLYDWLLQMRAIQKIKQNGPLLRKDPNATKSNPEPKKIQTLLERSFEEESGTDYSFLLFLLYIVSIFLLPYTKQLVHFCIVFKNLKKYFSFIITS